jgi:hypothetical protein
MVIIFLEKSYRLTGVVVYPPTGLRTILLELFQLNNTFVVGQLQLVIIVSLKNYCN